MMSSAARSALEARLGERVAFDVPMARHTSLRVGGPADAVATPADVQELADLLALCARLGLRHWLLGAGFNVLVRDEGLDGVVIVLRKLRGLREAEGPLLIAETGVSHAQITRFCTEHGLAGLEFGAGIPGTVGGWVAMNAGIGVRELEDVVEAIELLGADGGGPERIERDALDFHYRELAGLPEGSVVVRATLRVSPSTPEAVKTEVDRLLATRAKSQPLNVPSCGSVFRNPENDFAGRLIEEAGLKGLRVGGAEISLVHANFIANVGGATASDVLALIEQARDAVRERTGIELRTEVQIMGRAA